MNDPKDTPSPSQQPTSAERSPVAESGSAINLEEAAALVVLSTWVAADPRRRIWSEGGALQVLDEHGRGTTLTSLARASTRQPFGVEPTNPKELS